MRLDGRLLPRSAFGLLAHQNEWMMTIPIIKKWLVAFVLLRGTPDFRGLGPRSRAAYCRRRSISNVCGLKDFSAPDDTVRTLTPEQYADCMRQEGFLGPDSLMTPEMRQRGMALLDLL